MKEAAPDLSGRALPVAVMPQDKRGDASIVCLFTRRNEYPTAGVFPSPTIAPERVRWPLAEAVAILDCKTAHVREAARHRDGRHAFLRFSPQQCIPDLREPCLPQIADG
jgi:hypothetical protein